MNNEDLKALYPSTPPAQPPQTKDAGRDQRALHEADTAEVLFGGTVGQKNGLYGSDLNEGLERLADDQLLDSKQVDTLRKETATVFHELHLDSTTASAVHSLLVSNTIDPPTESQRTEWQREAHAMLRERYGDQAKARLEAAKEFVRARPKLQTTLNQTGIGNHPTMVLELAEAAWKRRLAGKK